jgi:glycosyltransferase involved in cell wall biosynthesis
MRLLFLSTWFPHPTDNGSKIRIAHLLRALAARHQVTLLSFAFGTATPHDAGDLARFCADVQTVPLDPFAANRSGALARFLSPGPVVARPLPAMRRLVASTLAHTSFDAVVASSGAMAAYALVCPAPRHLLEEHNSLTRLMYDRYRQQTCPLQRHRCWASWRKAAGYEARLFSRFDLVTMVSEPDAEASRRLLARGTRRGRQPRVEVVPNGVDCDSHQLGLALPVPGTLVFNGALTYSANYDAMRYFLSEIFPWVRAVQPGTTLTITGSHEGVDLADLPLGEGVRLTGFVDDVRPHVARAWACVVPVREGGGTRLKILEAMALGTPVIASPKGAEGLDVTPDYDILIARDPAAFAHQVLRLLREPSLRSRLSANARLLVEQRYDWLAIGRRFAGLVDSLEPSAP